MLGLEVQHVDERRLCCDSAERCAAQTGPGNVCLAYFEMACAGICAPGERLEPIFHSCLEDPLHKPRSELGAGIPPWDIGLAAGPEDEDEVEADAKPVEGAKAGGDGGSGGGGAAAAATQADAAGDGAKAAADAAGVDAKAAGGAAAVAGGDSGGKEEGADSAAAAKDGGGGGGGAAVGGGGGA